MMRKLALALALSCMATLAYALGLGNLQLNSNLNEPLDGKIELIGATADELDSLRVTLASIDEFRRAGLEKPLFLSKLRFRLVREDNGLDHIKIWSNDPVREPFLDFLLEVNWATGRFIREYTVLLDPPVFDDGVFSTAGGTLGSDFDRLPNDASTADEMTAQEQMAPSPAAGSRTATRRHSGEGILVGKNDTLWSLASAHRPDTGVSVQQMMLALLNANPEAFQQNNVNTLKAGYVLRVPDRATLTAIAQSDALETVKQHHAAWQQYRLGQSESTPIRPSTPASPATASPAMADDMAASTATDSMGQTADSSAEPVADEGRLELVVPSADQPEDSESNLAGSGEADTDISELEQEQLESTLQANEELQEQLTDADEIIALLERKIELQDNELAGAQQVFANQAYEQEVIIREDEYPGYELIPEGEPDWKVQQHEVVMFSPVDQSSPTEADWMRAEHEVVTLNPVEEAASSAGGGAPEEPAISSDEDQGSMTEAAAADEATVADSDDDLMSQEVAMSPESEGGALDGLTALVASVIPASLLALIPGGALSLLGVLLLLVILVIWLLVKLTGSRDKPVESTVTEPDKDTIELSDETDTLIADEPLIEVQDESAEPADSEATDAELELPEPGMEMGADTITDLQATLTEEEVNAAMAEEEEEDPLEEVNVYLAYERFDTAEEVVRKAIAENPDQHKFKLRLLEVFYSANDHAKYEEAAQELYDATAGQGPLWDSAVNMWAEMSPDRELFAEGETQVSGDQDKQSGFVDLTDDSGDEAADAAVLDISSADDDSLDFSLDDSPDGADDGILDVTEASDGGEKHFDPSTEQVPAEEAAEVTAPGRPDDPLLETTDSGLLDITTSGDGSLNMDDFRDSGEDLLDVTTVSPPTDALELNDDDTDQALEFDVSSLGDADTADADTENILDIGLDDDLSGESAAQDFDFDLSEGAEENTDDALDTASTQLADDGSFSLDLDSPESESDDDTLELTAGSDGAFDLDSALDSEDDDVDVDTIKLGVSDDEEFEFDISDDEDSADSVGGLDLALDDGEDDDAIDLSADPLNDSLDELAESLGDTVSLSGNEQASTIERAGSGLDLALDEEDEFTLSLDDEQDDDFSFSLDTDEDTDSGLETVELDKSDVAAEEQTLEDEIDTRLNLAKAYIELGDKEGASIILDEVSRDGDERQQQEASELLKQLD